MSIQSDANFNRAADDALVEAEHLLVKAMPHEERVLTIRLALMKWYSRGSHDGSADMVRFVDETLSRISK